MHNQEHIEDFRSIDSIDNDMAGRDVESRDRRARQAHFNDAFGPDDDIQMMDMISQNDGHVSLDDDDDNASHTSTDTHNSSASIRSRDQSLKESLPSHLFREIRALPSAKGARRNICRDTGSARHPRQRISERGGSAHGRDETDFGGIEDHQNQRDEIRHMATSLDRKKNALNEMQTSLKNKEQNISLFKYYKLRLADNFQRFKKKITQVVRENQLWGGDLKKIQGKFGTGVLSYFVFIRWLFWLNVLIFLLMMLFIFIPQIIYRPSRVYGNLESFDGINILDGAGWFNGTEMYYGYYTNDHIPITNDSSYDMPLAYFLTCGSYLIVCLMALVKSMANQYKDIYLQGGINKGVFTMKIFTSWDYSVTDREACAIKQQSIATDIEECLAETKDRRVLSLKEKFHLVCLRIVTHFICLALIACATYLIVEVVAGYATEGDTTIFKELLLPLLVSVLNLVLPGLFRIVASFENYEHGSTAVTMSLARTVILKLCTLAAIFVALYKEINCVDEIMNAQSGSAYSCRDFVCWENYVGQMFYRLVWVDFVFILLATFVGEFVRRLLSNNIEWWRDNIGHPGFDISRNVLDVIYAQCLCWFGSFFSPMLSLICLFKLWVLFYVKKISVLRNCRPSVRPFKASKMNLVYLFLLGVSYAVILVVLGYTVTSTESRLAPSDCGPFKGQKTIYSVILDRIDGFPKVIREIISYIASPSIIALIFVIIGVFTYYYKLLKISNEKKIKLLRQQIVLTGKDKLYLMKQINQKSK